MQRLVLASAVLVSFVSLAAVGCKKGGDDPAPMPPAQPIASSAPMASAVTYMIEPTGKTTIDMPAPKERIKAETDAAKGMIHVDLANLANTRGDIFIDLETLSTHTFGNDDDKTQTKHAHTWLQIDDMEKDTSMRDRNRWVHFAIRSIDGLSAPDATKVAPVKEGADDVRSVTLTAHGELELHALPSKGLKDVALEIKLHYPAGAAADSKPASIEIKSKSPLVITLGDHDVKPRDNEGILAQKAFSLLGTKVADVANVSIDLRAKLGS
jgi:hypothetical protein